MAQTLEPPVKDYSCVNWDSALLREDVPIVEEIGGARNRGANCPIRMATGHNSRSYFRRYRFNRR